MSKEESTSESKSEEISEEKPIAKEISPEDALLLAQVAKEDAEQRELGFTKCMCNNWFNVDLINCPFCKRFNAATSILNCPTCGQLLPK